ncbi:hypothetical protein [Novosphingopyxis sp.]|uniref:hypothetical protein n=1 Tax=Novosphingopyxis sp. TaxID=2709690 RepID=UPI003B592E9E
MINPTEALRAEVAGLRTDVQALTSGLMLMLEVQETHGELLRELGEALGQEPDGPSPVAEALEALAAIGRDQTAAIERLSQRIVGATLRGVGSPAS